MSDLVAPCHRGRGGNLVSQAAAIGQDILVDILVRRGASRGAEAEIFHGDVEMVVATGEMGELGIAPRHAPLITKLKPGQYILLRSSPDEELKRRWKIAHDIRRAGGSAETRLLALLRANVGKVVKAEIPSETFRDAIVLIGPTTEVMHDVFPTAFARSGNMPGVEIHANVLETYFLGNAIQEVPRWLSTVLAAAAGILGSALVVRFHALRALYVTIILSSGVALVMALALAGAIALAALAFDSATKEAEAVGDAAVVTSLFWVGLAFLAVYHVLWVVYILALTTVWPLKVVSSK